MLRELLDRIRKARKDWESYCLRCGLCCYEKDLQPGGEIYINLKAPCPYLDKKTNLCTVYEHRFRTCGECRKVNLYHVLVSRYMPSSCGYVKRFRKIYRRPPIIQK